MDRIRRKRPSLRLIISSATLDAQSFLSFFTASPDPSPSLPAPAEEDATIVSLEGRMYPVDLAYLSAPCTDYVSEAVRTVMRIHLSSTPGDVLVFLTGREEIDRALDELGEAIPSLPPNPNTGKLTLLPLHAGLPPDEQQRVFDQALPGERKVIISTNIAEASVTIDGVRFVVDCGFVKLRSYDPGTSMSRLVLTPTSFASATQRAGRAGRTSRGTCYRLYPEDALPLLPRSTPPELVRSDLALPILQLRLLGIENLNRFEWVTPPPAENVVRALEFLVLCGAVDREGRTTGGGERMGEMAVDLRMAKCVSPPALSSSHYCYLS